MAEGIILALSFTGSTGSLASIHHGSEPPSDGTGQLKPTMPNMDGGQAEPPCIGRGRCDGGSTHTVGRDGRSRCR